MIWEHKARMHWVCNDVEGLSAEIKIVDGVTNWCTIDLETGEILSKGTQYQPVDAIHYIERFFKAIVDKRNAIEI